MSAARVRGAKLSMAQLLSAATMPFGTAGEAVSDDKGVPSRAARRLRPRPLFLNREMTQQGFKPPKRKSKRQGMAISNGGIVIVDSDGMKCGSHQYTRIQN
eukprot:2482541-Rhodomonas_salina.2